MIIREAKPADAEQWVAMRSLLWPESRDTHDVEISDYFNGKSIDIELAYIAEVDATPIGFLELNIRNFAEGSRKPKVPYVEAWYIKPKFQSRGYGSGLMKQAEKWALSKGYTELASDTDVDNTQSIAMHAHLGFTEVERIVCFLKRLKNI